MKINFYLLVALLLFSGTSQGQTPWEHLISRLNRDSLQSVYFLSNERYLFLPGQDSLWIDARVSFFEAWRDSTKTEVFKTLIPAQTQNKYTLSYAGVAEFEDLYLKFLKAKYNISTDAYPCTPSPEEEQQIKKDSEAIEKEFGKNIYKVINSDYEALRHHLGLMLDENHTEKAVNFDTLPSPGMTIRLFNSQLRNTFDCKTIATPLFLTPITLRCVIDEQGRMTEAAPLPEAKAMFARDQHKELQNKKSNEMALMNWTEETIIEDTHDQMAELLSAMVLNTFAAWKPGIYQGKKVRSVVYIHFELFEL